MALFLAPLPALFRAPARTAAWALAAAGATLAAGPAAATPLLRCEIEQGDTHLVQDFAATRQPYDVRPLDVEGNFRFKAVVFAEGPEVDYVKLYTYYYLRGQPVLIHMAQHDSPKVSPSANPGALTGLQRVYSPRMGRELRYQCALRQATP